MAGNIYSGNTRFCLYGVNYKFRVWNRVAIRIKRIELKESFLFSSYFFLSVMCHLTPYDSLAHANMH